MSGRSEREKRREERIRAEGEAAGRERRKRLTQIVSGAVFLAVVAVAVVIVVGQNETSGGDTNLEEVAQVNSLLKGVPQRGTTIGDPQAKVKLIEFGDLQCPVCKAYSEEVLPQVIEGPIAKGSAKLEFRNFTIIGPQSTPAGAAAIAAGEQGRGWNYIELFYRNQGTENSGYATDAFLESIAKGAGVADLSRWNTARKSQSVLAEVSATTHEAERIGFTGTPSLAVEGPRTKGLEPLGTPGSAGALESAIEGAG